MYSTNQLILLFMILLLLGACSPDMSTREPLLTQIALLESVERSQQLQERIQDQVNLGSQYLAAIEDTANQNRVMILKLDTVFQIRYRKKMEEWTLCSEKGLRISRRFQQRVQDRHSKLQASSWEESLGDRTGFEQEASQFEARIKETEAVIVQRAQELRQLSNSMDTIPVPKLPLPI